MITSLRLVDGAAEMVLIPHPDITVTALNLGFPDVRVVSEGRSDDDGETDTTELYGARAVSIAMGLYTTPAALAEQLKAFCSPRARPYLHVIDTEWSGERRLRLRVDQVTDPIEDGADDVYRGMQATWRAPDGVWEATELATATIAAESTTTTGMTFAMTFPLSWPTTTAAGIAQILNAGPVPLHWVARLYGPCDGPRLTNDTTGEVLRFASGTGGLAVAAGEYVEVNTRDRSAHYLSDTGASRLHLLDFATSTWWQLGPGVNLIRYNPAAGVGAGASAVLEYRPAGL